MSVKDIKLIRGFIEEWLAKDYGEHEEWSIVQDMKMLIEGLDETAKMREESE